MTAMENKYRLGALRLLAEDARLTARARRLVVALMRATPVAPRGVATMVPLSELTRTLRTDAADPAWQDGTACDVLNTLDEVDAAHWSMPFVEEAMIGTFLKGYALSEESGLLHFQVDSSLIAAIDQISQQLRANSNEPPEMKH
jgi:hypothetical protein